MLELETSRHIWVQRDQAAEGSAFDRHCPCSPCRTNKLKKQKKANKNKKNHRPVDSAERVHSRTAESSSFTVITKTDLLATWAFQCFNLSFAWDEMIVEKNCNYWHCTAGETSWSWTLETAFSSSTNFFQICFLLFWSLIVTTFHLRHQAFLSHKNWFDLPSQDFSLAKS